MSCVPPIRRRVTLPLRTHQGILSRQAHGLTSQDVHRTGSTPQLGPIGPRLLARFACDAILQKALLAPTGAILDLGRDTRTITTAQRRALNARDRGCIIPGCPAPPTWCDGHHIRWWRHGGTTDLTNLALLCPRHHTLVHLGIWTLTTINALPWARPPDWIDPHQKLLRNTLHHATDQAHTLGTQIRLSLQPPPEHAPPPDPDLADDPDEPPDTG